MSKPEKLSEAELLALFDEMTTHVRDNGYCEYEWHTKHGCGFYAAQHGETCPVTKVRRALAELAAKDAEIAERKAAAESEAAFVNELNARVEQAEAENEKKDAEIARLREALGPFRNSAKHGVTPVTQFVCEGDWVRAAEALGG